MNPTLISQAPSLVRALLGAGAVVVAFGVTLGALWHHSEGSAQPRAFVPAAGSHNVAWR